MTSSSQSDFDLIATQEINVIMNRIETFLVCQIDELRQSQKTLREATEALTKDLPAVQRELSVLKYTIKDQGRDLEQLKLATEATDRPNNSTKDNSAYKRYTGSANGDSDRENKRPADDRPDDSTERSIDYDANEDSSDSDSSASDSSASDESATEESENSDVVVVEPADAQTKKDEEELDDLLKKFWPQKKNCREKLDERQQAFFSLMATELNIKDRTNIKMNAMRIIQQGIRKGVWQKSWKPPGIKHSFEEYIVEKIKTYIKKTRKSDTWEHSFFFFYLFIEV